MGKKTKLLNNIKIKLKQAINKSIKGHYAESITLITEALKIYDKRNLQDKELYVKLNSRLADSYAKNDQLEQGIERSLLALKTIEECPKKLQEHLQVNKAVLYLNLAEMFRAVSQFEDALQSLNRSLEIRKELDQNNSEIDKIIELYKQIGVTNFYKKDFSSALIGFNKALSLYDKFLPNHEDIVALKSNLYKFISDCLFRTEDYEAAIKITLLSLKMNKEICSDPNKNPNIIDNYLNLGLINQKLGYHELAYEYLKKVKEYLSLKLNELLSEIDETNFQLGSSAKYIKGKEYLPLKSHELRSKIAEIAEINFQLGSSAIFIKRKEEEAKKYLAFAANIFKQIGIYLFMTGDFINAKTAFSDALQAKQLEFQDIPHSLELAELHSRISTAYFNLHEFNKAIEHALKINEIYKIVYKDDINHIDLIDINDIIHNLYTTNKQHDKALIYAKISYQKRMDTNTDIKDEKLLSNVRALISLINNLENNQEAISFAEKFIKKFDNHSQLELLEIFQMLSEICIAQIVSEICITQKQTLKIKEYAEIIIDIENKHKLSNEQITYNTNIIVRYIEILDAIDLAISSKGLNDASLKNDIQKYIETLFSYNEKYNTSNKILAKYFIGKAVNYSQIYNIDPKECIKHLEKALEFIDKIKDPNIKTQLAYKCYIHIGSIYDNQYNFNMSLQTYNKAYGLINNSNIENKKTKLLILQGKLADAYFFNNNFQNSIKHAQKALTSYNSKDYQDVEELYGYFQANKEYIIAFSNYKLGNKKKAIDYFIKSAKSYKANDENNIELIAINASIYLANCKFYLLELTNSNGSWSEINSLYQHSIQLIKENNTDNLLLGFELFYLYKNIAITYQNINNYPHAFEYFNKAMQLKKFVSDSELLSIYSSLGKYYYQENNNPKALELYKSCISILSQEKPSNKMQAFKADILRKIANVYLNTGDIKNAVENYGKSLKITNTTCKSNLATLAESYILFANDFIGVSNYKIISDIIDLCKKCISRLYNFKQTKKSDHILILQCKIAQLYSYTNHEKASLEYKNALKKYSATNKPNTTLLIEKYIEQADFEFENNHYTRAINIYKNTLDTLGKDNVAISDIYSKIVKSYIELVYIKKEKGIDYYKDLHTAVEFSEQEYTLKKELYKNDLISYPLNLATENMTILRGLASSLKQEPHEEPITEKSVSFSTTNEICKFDNNSTVDNLLTEFTPEIIGAEYTSAQEETSCLFL